MVDKVLDAIDTLFFEYLVGLCEDGVAEDGLLGGVEVVAVGRSILSCLVSESARPVSFRA